MKAFKFLTIFLSIVSSYAFAQFTNMSITTNTYDQSEPTIAVSPLNSNNVMTAWNEFRSEGYSKAGYAFSTNKGGTWTEGPFLLSPPDRPTYKFGFDPSVSYDRYGNAFYTYIATPGGLGAVYSAKTTNGGISWTYKQVSSLATDQDKPFMAVDNTGGPKDGRIYVSWTDFSSGTAIKFSYSANHGVTFSTPITLGSSALNPGSYAQFMPSQSIPMSPTTAFVQGSMPAVAPNGDVYVIWMNVDYGYNASSYKIRKSTDGGVTFGSPVTAALFTWQRRGLGRADIFNLPSLAIDPKTGNLYVAYMDQVSQTNQDMRVKFIYSTNGGTSWSTPTIIADFGVGWQFFPWFAVDETGRVSVFLMHSADLDFVDSYITESYDNGLSFLSPLRVSTQSSDPSNATWTHHYHGIANIVGGDNYCIWTDYRNGNADPYFSLANTLYHYAAQNKSVDYTATYSNSARNQVKGAGYLHEVFSSGGEIFYRQSSDGGEHFGIPERITTGNGNNQRACITYYNWTPSKTDYTTLAAVWERKINIYQYQVWYSSSDAQTINWSTPQKLADVIIKSAQSGALPVISSLEYQGDIQLVVVYCSKEGLHYRLYFPSSSSWAIPDPEIIDGSNMVRFPSLSSSNNFLSLLYEIRGQDGVFSRKYTGASWTSSYHVADVTGTWYNRSPSITIDPENHPLAAWRGQISYDPCYSLLFRYGYSNNTWSDFYAIFEHPDEISLNVPSITYYKKTGISTYGIKIAYDNSINEIRLKEYDIGNLWDDILVTTGGRFPNMTEEDYTSGNPVYCWTDQDGPPYTITNNTYCGLPCHGGNKVLAGLEKGQTSIQHPRTSFSHKRRGVVLDTLSGSSLILDVEPIVVQTSDGREIILPFKPIAVHQPINLTSSNYNGYLGNDTLTLPSNATGLVFKSHVSTPAGTDSSGITHNNLFAGNYSASLQVINVLNPAASISTNITSNSIVNVNLQSLAGRQVIIKPTVTLNNLSGSPLKFGVGDVYSPVQSAPKENLTGLESATIIPNRIKLENNYPNPFNPVTTIRFSLPENQQVRLTIYTITGERIATLVSGFLDSGQHRVEWNGTNQAGTPVASGIYLYELKARNEKLVKKMLLTR